MYHGWEWLVRMVYKIYITGVIPGGIILIGSGRGLVRATSLKPHLSLKFKQSFKYGALTGGLTGDFYNWWL